MCFSFILLFALVLPIFFSFVFVSIFGCFLVILRAKKIKKNTLYSVQLDDEWMVKQNQHRQQETANTADCKICLKVKGEVVPENRAEIESSIRKSLNNVVAPDSVEVSKQHHAFFAYL